DVQLPAEVADIGDAGGENALRAHLDHPTGAELEAGARDVVGGDRGQDVARARAPQTDRRYGRGQVGQLGTTVGGQMVTEPLLVRHAGRATGDDAEVLVA